MASQRQQGHLLSHVSAGFTVGLCLTGKTAQPPELEAQGCLEATFVHHGHHLLPPLSPAPCLLLSSSGSPYVHLALCDLAGPYVALPTSQLSWAPASSRFSVCTGTCTGALLVGRRLMVSSPP